MSLLTVTGLTHGFGDRAIFNNVSFQLNRLDKIGLVGANGEGKSTFMNIITGKLMPDEGKVEWAKNVRVGYLDQHAVLEKGMTIQSVLASAFDFLYDMENQMNEIYAGLGDASPEEMDKLMAEAGTIQDLLTMHDFYMIDAKVEEVARALGLSELGLDKDVTELSGGQRTKVLLGKLLLEKPDILLLDEPTNYLDKEHIEWLKRYLQDYENAFILISHDIPFLNSVINVIYHMDNQELNRYTGDYDNFQKVYAVKKAQLEAAYNKQQQEIAELKDFVARNKARVATRNMAMSRQKKLDNMDIIELAAEKPKPEFNFKTARTPGRYIFPTFKRTLVFLKEKGYAFVMEKENLKQYDYSVTYNAEEMDVTDPEQKEELAQSLIREWECPAWLETEAGVSVKVALNSTESAGESLNGIEFAVLKAKEPEFIKKIVETGEEEE